MKEELRRKHVRRTILLGGALISSATAFCPGLAHVVVTVAELNPPPGVVYPNASPYFLRLMIHASTMGMLVSCVGAFLGIFSRGEKQDIPRLGFAGIILGLLGFLLWTGNQISLQYPKEVFF